MPTRMGGISGPYGYYYEARRSVGAPCMLRADPRRGDTTIWVAAIFSLDRRDLFRRRCQHP
jgi:hypothetical protein